MLRQNLFLLFLLLFICFSNLILAQNLPFLKTKITEGEVLWADPFSEPFDSLGNWQGTGLQKQDTLLLLQIREKKDSLENFVVELLKENKLNLEQKMGLAHLAAYLGYSRAVEPIGAELLRTSRMWGWEGPNYELLDSYLEQAQYPFQAYYWACLKALLKKNPAESISQAQYREIEKSLSIFLEKYAQETFLPSDSTFETLAWHYVLMKKINPQNALILNIEAKLEKRQVWAVVLGSDRDVEKARFELEKLLKQNPSLSKVFFSLYQSTIKGKIWYRTTVFCSTAWEAKKLAENMKQKRSDSFVMLLPCYPPRRSHEDGQVYYCEGF